jgi:DNA-binding NtrC family response regulator
MEDIKTVNDREVAIHPDSLCETILVVEDCEELRDIIVECLLDKQPGLSIETASNGVEALDRIAERAPSILITNMNMPKMNGIDLLKTLHERGISIPTLVTSGWWTQEAFEKELAERGVVPEKIIVFLQKPFRFDELGVLVEKLRQDGDNNLKSQ